MDVELGLSYETEGVGEDCVKDIYIFKPIPDYITTIFLLIILNGVESKDCK
jgi:hypothetical protein